MSFGNIRVPSIIGYFVPSVTLSPLFLSSTFEGSNPLISLISDALFITLTVTSFVNPGRFSFWFVTVTVTFKSLEVTSTPSIVTVLAVVSVVSVNFTSFLPSWIFHSTVEFEYSGDK